VKQNKGSPQPSIENYIDVALLKQKTVAISISEEEYLQLTASLSFILDSPKILLIGSPNLSRHFVEGFGSIYKRLLSKFSHQKEANFKGVGVFLFVLSQKNVEYHTILKKHKIHTGLDYEYIIEKLLMVGYERVDRVENVNQFCTKGGIIDIFSPLYSRPIRVCLYEEEKSIKFYNIETGLSLGGDLNSFTLNEQSVLPGSFALKKFFNNQDIDILSSGLDLMGGMSLVDYVSLKTKKLKNINYSNKIHFSAYSFQGEVFAPKIYKNGGVLPQPPSLPSLEVGDFVCHEDFGIGILKGFVENHKKYKEDLIKLEYEDGQILLSAGSLHKISLVSRETNQEIKLNSLSRAGFWKKTKTSISKAIDEQVKDVVFLYQQKKNVYRDPFVYFPDLEDVFVDSFPYADTPDQKKVWKEIKNDLESNSPMYRLLCGDVGFGKTELAIRVAFRVAANNKKTIVLVPTSVLAVQHHTVFSGRLKRFGVNVGILTGATTRKDKEKIKDLWVRGTLDVLIGTSAVLYDVDFIGFSSVFIVDEEHRFGVKDKEVVLNKFANKDVLFMSATPIPRTLNLSLSGVNSISTLTTPPISRLPIRSFVVYFDKELIKRAVDFELSRNGQVFYVHNEISTIGSVKSFLKDLCPYLSVEVAHSQVPKNTLKKRLLNFVKGGVDLLLCTSIIGSGIDIPNANTILINKAQLFGLAQLHQIRGRVGRGNQRAFAYFMVSKGARVTKQGHSRLKTISKHVSLGSGYAIAKADMKIRGGGTVFGYKQSGKAFALGYDYYSKLVAKKVSLSFKNDLVSFVDKFVYSVDFSCFFSKQYISSTRERLSLYKLLVELYDKEKIDSFSLNLTNIYGPQTKEVQNLISMRVASLFAGRLRLLHLNSKKNILKLVFDDSFQETSSLFELLKNKRLDSSIQEYFFKVLNDATSLELVIKKGVILDGLYIKLLLERLCVYGGF